MHEINLVSGGGELKVPSSIGLDGGKMFIMAFGKKASAGAEDRLGIAHASSQTETNKLGPVSPCVLENRLGEDYHGDLSPSLTLTHMTSVWVVL